MDKDKIENFLQSLEWRKFQESAGKKTFFIENEYFSASIIEHELPLVGNYLYVPRGPLIACHSERIRQLAEKSKNPETNMIDCNITGSLGKLGMTGLEDLIGLAKKENAGWIRFDPADEKILESIKNNISYKIAKAPHDMQPKEIFVMDISKSEEQLLAEMKPKTRYNIRLSQKQGVSVKAISCTNINKPNFTGSFADAQDDSFINYRDDFLRLTKEMAKRQGIATHPETYYRKMVAVLSEKMLKIYVAEYENKTIAANLILFYGESAIYLHGASGNEHRNVMAPYLLQWQAIMDAKKAGYKFYDFGGISTNYPAIAGPRLGGGESNTNIRITNKWQGITNFKLGFSPETAPIVFSGSYDIIIHQKAYLLYKVLQRMQALLSKIRK